MFVHTVKNACFFLFQGIFVLVGLDELQDFWVTVNKIETFGQAIVKIAVCRLKKENIARKFGFGEDWEEFFAIHDEYDIDFQLDINSKSKKNFSDTLQLVSRLINFAHYMGNL